MSCASNADTPIEVLSDFAANWLYDYNAEDYDLMLYPYNMEDSSLEDMGGVWDFNGDEIVNLADWAILAQLDMSQLITDTKNLQGTFTSEHIQTLIDNIIGTEKTLNINNLRLFKILLFEANFEVIVYNYSPGIFITDFDFLLYWENDIYEGWINLLFDFKYLFNIPTGYTYSYDWKYWVKE